MDNLRRIIVEFKKLTPEVLRPRVRQISVFNIRDLSSSLPWTVREGTLPKGNPTKSFDLRKFVVRPSDFWLKDIPMDMMTGILSPSKMPGKI